MVVKNTNSIKTLSNHRRITSNTKKTMTCQIWILYQSIRVTANSNTQTHQTFPKPWTQVRTTNRINLEAPQPEEFILIAICYSHHRILGSNNNLSLEQKITMIKPYPPLVWNNQSTSTQLGMKLKVVEALVAPLPRTMKAWTIKISIPPSNPRLIILCLTLVKIASSEYSTTGGSLESRGSGCSMNECIKPS